MTKKKQLQETISDLEAGIKSPATPEMFKSKMKAELEKNKKALADLEAEEEEKKKKKEKKPAPKPIKPTGGKRGRKPSPKPEQKPTKRENPIEKAKRLARERRKKQTGVPTGAGDIERDAARPAKPIGKRVSKEGNTYYEYRDNRIDKKQPPKRYPKLEDGGMMSDGGEIASFENKIKDALKEENKWHFINEKVGNENVQLKMFVGKKEVDVQIFRIGALHAKMPRNYVGKRETLKMIMDNFQNKMEDGGELFNKGGVVKKLIGKTVRITSDNENYEDFKNMDLVITHAEIGGRGYDDSVYPEALCDLKVKKTGKEVPYSLYEYEFEVKHEDGGELTPTPDSQFDVQGAGMFDKGGMVNRSILKNKKILDSAKEYKTKSQGIVLGFPSTWEKDSPEGRPIINFSYFDDEFTGMFLVGMGVVEKGIIQNFDSYDPQFECEIDALRYAYNSSTDENFDGKDAGMFARGGALNHGLMKGDTILDIYKGYAIIENNNNGVIQVINPEQGTRFVIDLDDSKMSGARTSSGMSKEDQMEAAKVHIDNSRPIQLGMMDGNRDAEFAFGGRLNRNISRDRLFKSKQPHEQRYERKTSPKNPKYKYEEGGELHRMDGQQDIFEDGGIMTNLQDGGLDADFRFDINSPQFKNGGKITSKYNYLSARDIESVTTWDGVNIDGDKILDGIYIKKGVKF